MLSLRLSSRFKVVSIYDEATLDIPDKLMVLYSQKRDFDLIADEVEKLTPKPTIFHVIPLKTDKEYLVDAMITNGSEAAKSIFRHHVKGADNYAHPDGSPVIQFDDDDLVDKESIKGIPRDIVQEIAGVIVTKANESTKPFMMPDTWLRTRVQSRALRAEIANIENAKQKDTE